MKLFIPLKFIIVTANFFYCSVCFSQIKVQKIDSMKRILASAQTDSTKVKLLFFIGQSSWFNRNMPEAISYLGQTITVSAKAGYYKYACDAKLLLGHVYIRMQRFDSALTSLNDALDCSIQNKQPEHIPKVHQAFGILYNLLGDPARAISYGLKAAEGYESSPVNEINVQSIFAWLEVGKIFEQQKQYDKAQIYYSKAVHKAEQTGKEWLVKAPRLSLAGIFAQQGRMIEARQIFTEVLALDRKAGGAEPTMDALYGLGNIAIVEKQFNNAVQYFHAALDTAINRNFTISIDGFADKLGFAYFVAGEPDSAFKYYMLALDASTGQGDLLIQKSVYGHLAELEFTRGDLNKAIQYQKMYQKVSDSLYNSTTIQSVNNLEILYETEKKQKEISALNATNAVKQLAIVKKNRVLLIGSIAAAALLMILGLLYRNTRQRQIIAEKEQKLQHDQIIFLERQQQVVSLQSMINGQETERTRIAKDLHDGLGGLFSTVKMYFSTLRHDKPELNDNEIFNKSYELVDNASVEVRRIAHNMMPEVLMKIGLVDALKDMCNNINAGKLMQISLQAYGMEKRLNPSTEIMLYRIVQELLNNIIKHAKASEGIIQFNRDGNKLQVTVEDNGHGFNTKHSDDNKHAGLDTVQSRVNYLNGNMSIESKQGMGTTVLMDFMLYEE